MNRYVIGLLLIVHCAKLESVPAGAAVVLQHDQSSDGSARDSQAEIPEHLLAACDVPLSGEVLVDGDVDEAAAEPDQTYCLTSGTLTFTRLPQTEIPAFDRLLFINGELIITDNEDLARIDLAHVTYFSGSIKMEHNPKLESIQGVSHFTRLHELELLHLPALTSLDAFANLTHIADDLGIVDSGLESLAHHFPVLTTIGQDLEIKHNAHMTQIDDFTAITSIGAGDSKSPGDLEIETNPLLKQLLPSLEQLETCDGELKIVENPQLKYPQWEHLDEVCTK